MKVLLFLLLTLLVFQTNPVFSQSDCNKSEHLISWGFNIPENKREIDLIIIHSTYYANSPDSFSVEGVLKQFKQYGVSAHYLIDRSGKIFHLVAEQNISFHAGKSKLPNGREKINTSSIGIEVITSKESSPTSAQYQALNCLIKNIKSRYKISYIGGHSDIAPDRKSDPWNFDWDQIR